VRHVLRIVLFPWLIWDLVAAGPAWLRARLGIEGGLRRHLLVALHTVLYACIGLPATVLLTGEILISANERLIGEQADYRLQSDLAAGGPVRPAVVPGPPTPRPAPAPAPGPNEAWRRYLVERFAPVIVQKLAHHPEWDVPIRIDFDGNDDPRDNVDHEPAHRPHRAAVYGELTAETDDSYYLTYSLYHAKDYDHPLREWFTDWTYHDNDNEGLMLRVDRRTLRVVQVETWFHNRFLLYDVSGTSSGTEPIHGHIHLEDGRPIVYSQPQGHGVRLFQVLDEDALASDVKILRWQGAREPVPVHADRSLQVDATYELASFDPWYAAALGPFGSQGRGTSLFEDTIPLGTAPDGRPLAIGRYIAGRDYSKMGWSRPKPPWSWDDGWDRIPIFVWHFFPSYAFASHSGRALSHRYRHSRPVEKTFGVAPAELLARLRLDVVHREGDKWASLADRGDTITRRTYWELAAYQLKLYLNYLWHALG